MNGGLGNHFHLYRAGFLRVHLDLRVEVVRTFVLGCGSGLVGVESIGIVASVGEPWSEEVPGVLWGPTSL